MNDKSHISIPKCFNRAALSYALHNKPQQQIAEVLIDAIAREECSFLQAIDIGCGVGNITETLIHRINSDHWHAIDLAGDLLDQAKDKAALRDVSIREMNFMCLDFENSYFDFIFSNMALHWSSNLHNLILHLQAKMNNNGLLAFSIPLEGTFAELNASSRNEFLTQNEVLALLAHSNLNLIKSFEQSFVMPFASWQEAIRSIKTTGANYLFDRKKQSLSKRHRFHDIKQLTYQVGFFLLRK